MSFDLLYRGWEMNSGAVREHRYDELKEQIEEHGVDSSKMSDYLDFFKYGCPPHGGMGFGIERFLDLKNSSSESERENTLPHCTHFLFMVYLPNSFTERSILRCASFFAASSRLS